MVDRLLERLERNHRDHRPEDLFLRNPHLRVHVGEHRGLVEEPLRVRARVQGVPAARQRGALGPADADVVHHGLDLPAAHRRPHLHARVEAVAHLSVRTCSTYWSTNAS